VPRPETVEQAAALLRELGTQEKAVRPVGAGTKLEWGGGPADDVTDVETGGLNRILEHNVGDFTAVLEAGVPLSEAQAQFGGAGQMLAWDPPGQDATVGGIVATADSGPMRHRFGGVRDLVVGITVVLSDGTVAKAGGKVIKNVAGYDLGKLFAGSYGTLGLIASVAVRLHPLPQETAAATGATDDPERLLRVVLELSRHPLEASCLDVAWRDGSGRVLLRWGGAAAARQARSAAALMDLEGVEATEDDRELWQAQRAGQRSTDGAVLKVSGRPTDLPAAIRAAEGGRATVVSRAALGLSWLAFAPGDDLAERVATARQALAPRACTVLDGARRVGDPWPPLEPGALAVMERIKARFDPARIFRPGAFVGGI
jgi:glycolate oxidase FAD binding subunit